MAGEEHYEVRPEGMRAAAQGYRRKADELARLHLEAQELLEPGRLAAIVGDNDNSKTFLAGFTRSGGGVRDALHGWHAAVRATGELVDGWADGYDRAEDFATETGDNLHAALSNNSNGGPVNKIIDNLSTRR